MSLTRAKQAVSRFFKGRVAGLRLLNGRRVTDKSDFFELYVLIRLAKLGGGKVVPNVDKQGNKVFVVAGAPSPSWRDVSHIQLRGLGARTGLQVQCSPGSVELDVVLVERGLINDAEDRVPAAAAKVAFECKALRGKLKSTHANEIIGKADRVWAPLPLKPVQHGNNAAPKYCAVALNGASGGLDEVLASRGIGLADDIDKIDVALKNLLDAIPEVPRAPPPGVGVGMVLPVV